ncbi:MAG TPA: DUF3891 family protein [Thermoanaerobaculia bacterium]|nr:DUF3891 family protein [Thermoanaerobaculia bacterium]
MILYDQGENWRVVTQPDHARFAGELLALWRSDGLPARARRDDLLFATREHDNGWREADAAPSWNRAAGRPHDFHSLPAPERREVWRRGSERFADERPGAAVLILTHALWIADLSGGHGATGWADAEWEELAGCLAERRDELAAAARIADDEIAADFPFLRFADAASLAVCRRQAEPFEVAMGAGRAADGATGGTVQRGRFEPATETLYLDPFPLAGATTFRVPCRELPKQTYRGDADLGGALAAARWGRFRVRVAPPHLPG